MMLRGPSGSLSTGHGFWEALFCKIYLSVNSNQIKLIFFFIFLLFLTFAKVASLSAKELGISGSVI